MRTKKLLFLLGPYLISFGVTGLAFLLSLALVKWIGAIDILIIFLPAIMISTWYGGVLAGLVTNILSTILIYYCFMLPSFSLVIKSVASIAQLILFIIEGLIISYFIDSGQRYEKIELYRKKEQEQKKVVEDLQKKLAFEKEQTELRDEFLAIASHELKTPLTTVVLQLQTTLHNIRNVSLSEFSIEHLLKVLQSMQNQTTRLSKMINDLLNISLITTHKMELELEEVDLATLINDIAQGFAEKFEKEHTTLTVIVKDAVFGKWDKLRLEQVLDNLVSNALKYGNKKPIEILVERQGTMAVIRVTDHGIGIKSGEKEAIFSLFKRGTTNKEYTGMGIGLYIAQQIILLHNGRIELKSNYGRGSVFSIYLPIAK